jgi:hypothetical protein
MAQKSDDVYTGLPWRAGKGTRRLLVGSSELTPIQYIVDLSRAPQTFSLLLAFPPRGEDRKTLAQAELSTHGRLEDALVAAERHDFMFFRRERLGDGGQPVFRGSERVARFLAEGAPAAESDAEPVSFVANGASYFTAVKTAAKQNTDGSKQMTLRIEAAELPVWLDQAPMGRTLLLAAMDGGGAESDPEHEKRVGDVMRRARTLPQEAPFQTWLRRYDWWQLIEHATQFNSEAVETACVETLRRIAGVMSMAELHVSRDALERLEQVLREFYRDASLEFGKAKGRGEDARARGQVRAAGTP